MIILFEDKEEHEKIRELRRKGLYFERFAPFDNAYYINAYMIGEFIAADKVIAQLRRNKERKNAKRHI